LCLAAPGVPRKGGGATGRPSARGMLIWSWRNTISKDLIRRLAVKERTFDGNVPHGVEGHAGAAAKD